MKMVWYSVFFIFIFLFRTNLREYIWMRTTSAIVMVIFSKVSSWKLLDHSYVRSSFSTIIRHIDNTILKETPQLKILRTWINISFIVLSLRLGKASWNENQRCCLKSYKLHKNPSLHFEHNCTKIDLILPVFIWLFFSQTNLVFKFNLELIGVLDNFCHNLFFCLPFDYHLLFHWSWSSSSASIHFLNVH